MIRILGIDPGKTTGWGLIQFDEITKRLAPENFGTTRDLQLIEIEAQILLADRIVCESFHIRPKAARKGVFDWDPVETPQVIGALKLLCRLHEKPIYEQSPSIKPVGYGFGNMNYVPGKKGTHVQDAIAHAVYYAVRNMNALPLGSVKLNVPKV